MATNSETTRIQEVTPEELNKDDNEVSSPLTHSWVFVEQKADDHNLTSSREFYLNCSEEPFQELNEHDLGADHFDHESDSDGISVISESCSLTEKTDEEFAPADEHIDHQEVTKIQESSIAIINNNTNSFYPYQVSYMIAFSIILISIPLHWYLSPKTNYEIQTPEVTVESVAEPVNLQPHEHNENLNSWTDEEIRSDPLLYCSQLHKNTDYMFQEYEVKKCIRKIEKGKWLNKMDQKIEKKVHDLQDSNEDIEEIHLDYKSRYSKSNNDENKHEVYRKKIKYRKNSGDKSTPGYIKEYKVEKNTTSGKTNNYKYEAIHQENKNQSEHQNTIERKKNDFKQNDNHHNDYKTHSECEERLKIKEEYLKQKEQYLERKEHELKQKQMRDKLMNEKNNNGNTKERMKINSFDSDQSLPEVKNKFTSRQSNDRSLESDITSREKNENSESHSGERKKYSQTKESKFSANKKSRKYEKGDSGDDTDEYIEQKCKRKNKKNIKNDDNNQNVDINSSKYKNTNDEGKKNKNKHKQYKKENHWSRKSGNWYTEMFKERSKLRENDAKNDWLFDRARERSFMRKLNLQFRGPKINFMGL